MQDDVEEEEEDRKESPSPLPFRMMGVFYAQESTRQRRQDREDSGDGVEMSEGNKARQTPKERLGEIRIAVGLALVMTTLLLLTGSWRYLSPANSEPGRKMLHTVQQRGSLGGNQAMENQATNETETITVQQNLGPERRLPEPAAAVLSEDDKDRLALIEWIRGMPGGYVADISFGSFDHSGHSVRGIKADSAFAPGDLIIKVPRSVFVSPNDLHLERYEWAKTGRKLSMDVMLSLRLQEIIADEKERMDPFVKLLPSKGDYEKFHPLMASDMDVTAYSDLPIVEDVKRKKKEMERIHTANRLPGKFEDLWLAYVRTISRSYGVVYLSERGSKNGVGYLRKGVSGRQSWVAESVPLTDMANTDVPSKINTKWGYNNMEGAFYLNATKMISPGDELLESYQVTSRKDNHFLAYMFGFMEDGNPKRVRQLSKARCDRLLKNPPPARGEGIRQLFHKLSKEHCQESTGAAFPGV